MACRVDGVGGVAAWTRPSWPRAAGSVGPRRRGADAVAACADVDAPCSGTASKGLEIYFPRWRRQPYSLAIKPLSASLGGL